MPSLLSGSTLRAGGSGQFIDLANAMPQLPATETTETGFTIATNDVLITTYRSSLGFVEFNDAKLWAKKEDGIIKILATGTNFYSTSTQTGSLVVEGGIGVGRNMWVEEDIVVNELTIGQGFEGYNNIVLRGEAVVPPNDHNNGQEAIAIGYDTLLGLETANKVIAIGRNALSSGTEIRSSIAIGDGALKDAGTIHSIFAGTVTNATQTSPIVITAANHGVTTGTKVTFFNVSGMVQLNGAQFWANWIDSSTVALYSDNILSTPADGTGYSAYISGGTIERVLTRNNNVAIGHDAGRSMIDGTENFFIGSETAKNLTTGSYNIFIGNDTGANVNRASGIISIGGDNLIDGVDNQINIGSVFYYNGTGTATINADTEVGLGTESTSTTTGAFKVVGGAIVQRDLRVLRELHVTSSTFIYGDLLPGTTATNIGSATNPFNALYLKGTTLYLSTVTLKSNGSQDFTVESPAGYVRQTVGNLTLNSGLASSGAASGSLIVTGGAGIQGDVHISGELNVRGVEPVDLSPAATVYIQPTLAGSVVMWPATEGNIDNMAIGQNNAADGNFVNVEVQSSTSATSTSTGALTVEGGAGIKGDVYAKTGNPQENYLLYTPVTTVSTSTPTTPRVGDFWINPIGPYFLQYVQDGANRIWVQI